MIYALYDNFPIITEDTGAYIYSGFSLQPPSDRPIFYGVFIRLTSLGASLWLTVFFQCFILSYTLTKFIKKLHPPVTNLQLLAFILFIALFTTGGWFASQLMPDIFVAIMILAVSIYMVFPTSSKEKVALLAISFISVLSHNSNFIVLTVFCLLFLLTSFFGARLRQQRPKLLLLTSLAVLCWLTLCTTNWLGGLGFTTSRSTHVFVMGKLVESGVLKTYLDKACPVKNYRICNHKDNLPAVAWEFHWGETSPLQKEGGWDANRSEYNTIIRDIFSRPKYYPYIIYKSLDATARQLVQFNIDGSYALPWVKYDEQSQAYNAIAQHFPHELNLLKSSRINGKTLSIPFYDNVFAFVIVLSSILLMISLPSTQKPAFYRIALFLAIFILLNAFATAVLSSVNARFNARVIWLVPLINCIFLFRTFAAR
jgi:hypothetical protein